MHIAMLNIEQTTQSDNKKGRKKVFSGCIRRVQHCSIECSIETFLAATSDVRRSSKVAQRKFAKTPRKKDSPSCGAEVGVCIWRSLSEVTHPERPHTESHCEFSSCKQFFVECRLIARFSSLRTASIEPARPVTCDKAQQAVKFASFVKSKYFPVFSFKKVL